MTEKPGMFTSYKEALTCLVAGLCLTGVLLTILFIYIKAVYNSL